ncbi:MAG: ATP-dependent protease subunit HslV [candidate division Zixibacteria bacterium]|nr:ATP-dependent protease subunit HslV [candidate division Zixibacteria bacterium]
MIYHATTILGILHNGKAAIAGDGQVTLEDTVMKKSANKIRKLDDDNILAGFAGTAADAFTLFGRFEGKIEEFGGNLPRAAVELAKEWRTDKYLRRLEALLVALNKNHALVISGDGDVIEPDDGIVAIGSGGPYALAAARALMQNTRMNAEKIAHKSLEIAAEICIYTNDNITVETL